MIALLGTCMRWLSKRRHARNPWIPVGVTGLGCILLIRGVRVKSFLHSNATFSISIPYIVYRCGALDAALWTEHAESVLCASGVGCFCETLGEFPIFLLWARRTFPLHWTKAYIRLCHIFVDLASHPAGGCHVPVCTWLGSIRAQK